MFSHHEALARCTADDTPGLLCTPNGVTSRHELSRSRACHTSALLLLEHETVHQRWRPATTIHMDAPCRPRCGQRAKLRFARRMIPFRGPPRRSGTPPRGSTAGPHNLTQGVLCPYPCGHAAAVHTGPPTDEPALESLSEARTRLLIEAQAISWPSEPSIGGTPLFSVACQIIP
jgi:hypothetical protein